VKENENLFQRLQNESKRIKPRNLQRTPTLKKRKQNLDWSTEAEILIEGQVIKKAGMYTKRDMDQF
jgi:hypothetical protein